MERVSPSTTSRLPQGLALLIACAIGLAVSLGVVHLLLTSSPDRLFPRPFYFLKPVPGTYHLPPVPGTSDSPVYPGAAGADFAQIYFGARALRAGQSPYAKPSPDPFGRRPGYGPFTYWLAVPLTVLPYHAALLVHTFVQFGVFVAATAVALRLTGTLPHLPAVLCPAVLLLLMTRIGLAYLERGQFDLYVAASYLLVFTYLFRPRVSLVLGAGVLAALKWTALPLLGALALFVFVAGPRGSRRFVLFAAPLIAVASFLLLPDLRFIEHVQYWEGTVRPQGASLGYVMPGWIGKVLPILTALAVAAVLRYRGRDAEFDDALRAVAVPLGLALAIQGVVLGTASYEYRAVSLLGLVPVLAIWVERAARVPTALKAATVVGFGLFLVVAFRVHNLVIIPRLEFVVLIYLAASMGFAALATILAWRRPAPAPAASAAA
jgi:hypothetical protein